MRWQQQKIDDDAALVPIKGLIRSVRPPEFEGVTFHEVLCKSALNKVPGQSSMPFAWTVNPTRGCLHRCVYCFARKTHEYLDLNAGRDFDTQIVVKTNIAEVLRAELARPSWRHEHVALGTNSDPYMRAEGRYQLMPGIIGALADSGTPFSILTKGPLLKRDLPLLAEAPVPVEVGVSLAFADDDLQQSVEPGTPRPAARLALIRSIAEAGLDCTVLAMPVLPWLTDSVEHLDELFAGIKAAGARWVSAGALHLRPGAREWFLAWLRREHPALLPRYLELYGRGAYAPKDYREWLGARVDHLRRRHGFVRPTGVAAQEDRWQRSPAQQAPMPATPSATQPALF
ncbi:Rv2578c family radical SAM protein [Sediminivirga luteola]|uniref:Radical SAM protein n=1 Tax=Sediminivirga luteola TaxID=1774748 RepID=A0A8J2TXY5_9MICO|nr:Rv2578c family radical SAM protein [Sediminivirga luteola]MCI2265852.1 Rv2578c family radical SAM protein [Sediminivirga luteola]GGA14133.1 radical SAM protein [Sediminivirga luteola]